MFFQNYWVWLQAVLNNYIGTKVAVVAGALSPVIVTLATIYVMLWGYLMLTGQIKEPIIEGIKRIVTIAVILGIAVHLWLYNGPIVNTFFQAPFDLAAALVGAPPIAMIDTIWRDGFDVGNWYWSRAGILSGDFGLYIAAVFVWVMTGLLCVYTMFLLVLARIALSILLVLGPLFIALLFFDSTKRFFEAWIAQMANYGLIAILTGAVAALLLTLVNSFVTQTLAVGAGIQVSDAMHFVLSVVLTFLLMRQVMPMAAGLASGIALSTGNLVGRAVQWGLGGVARGGRGVWDAFTGGGTTRWDPLSRKLGYYPARGVARLGVAAWRGGKRMVTGRNTLSRK